MFEIIRVKAENSKSSVMLSIICIEVGKTREYSFSQFKEFPYISNWAKSLIGIQFLNKDQLRRFFSFVDILEHESSYEMETMISVIEHGLPKKPGWYTIHYEINGNEGASLVNFREGECLKEKTHKEAKILHYRKITIPFDSNKN